jgi:hypothetical protein
LNTLPKLDEVDKEADSAFTPVKLPKLAKKEAISDVVTLENVAEPVIVLPVEPLISADPVMLIAELLC